MAAQQALLNGKRLLGAYFVCCFIFLFILSVRFGIAV